MREEIVVPFFGAVPGLCGIWDNALLGKLGLLLEGTKADAGTLLQMGSLALAALQRLGNEQTEIFVDAVSRRPSDASPFAEAAVASLFASFAAASEVITQSHLELSEIVADRGRDWSDISRQLLGWPCDVIGFFLRS
ncbi:MAG TPA: hypothetical protein VHS58_04140 [Acetobacteraceae bacterium]|nr:hypothetical protein [Acetobacteraceae bacterium]